MPTYGEITGKLALAIVSGAFRRAYPFQQERSMHISIDISEIENGVLVNVAHNPAFRSMGQPRHYATIDAAAADLPRLTAVAWERALRRRPTRENPMGQDEEDTQRESTTEEKLDLAKAAFVRDTAAMDTKAFNRAEGMSQLDDADGMAEK